KLGMKPNLAPLGHLAPGSASSDYVRNAEQGAQTLLNTREYVYYSYYQRVRQQLEQFWEPNLRSRLKKFFAKGRTLASDKEHSTRLMVHLDKEGTITKIEVRDTSGLLELDQAAIDAFNKAGPFPNPPRGMLEANNGAVTVEWEFVLRT
ncbi:MAG TPA: energy transducer TonB, partial [Oligoflexia bacterium]|nr:energy transducer TonB [Oligoflexia bacterium]